MSQIYRVGFLGLMLLAVTSCKVIDPKIYVEPKPKNIIIMIGDGMGPAHLTAYRAFQDEQSTEKVENTIFDRLLVGMVSTSPKDDKQSVTDSAASATAYSTGKKSYIGAISYDVNKKPLIPLFERAVKQGKLTGLVVTSQVVHATPAAFVSSAKSRRDYSEISEQYANRTVEGENIVDVILGGGTQYFTTEKNHHLIDALSARGFQVSTDEESFKKLSNQKPMIGLYDKDGLQPYLDRKNSLITLPNMTKTALTRLNQNPQGFILLVEGSQIDWASHGDNILDAMWETHEFAKSVEVAVEFAKQDKNTLVLVTADHETGGLSLGSDGDYDWRPEILHKAKHSVTAMSKKRLAGVSWKEIFAEQSIEITDEQLAKAPTINFVDDQKEMLKQARPVYNYIASIYAELTQTGWTTSGHTGVDVWLMAYGFNADDFIGHWSNDDIGKKLIDLIE